MSFASFKEDVIKYFEKICHNTSNSVSVNSFNEKSSPLNNFCSSSSISLEVVVEAVAEVEAEAESEDCAIFWKNILLVTLKNNLQIKQIKQNNI